MDLIILAIIAVFVALRLRSELGKISEEEKDNISEKINQKSKIQTSYNIKPTQENSPPENNIIVINHDDKYLENLDEKNKTSVIAIMNKCSITLDFFITGAKSAFEMVIESFAKENFENLEMLLSEKVFQEFKKSIEERRSLQKILNTNLIAIENIEIVNALLDHNQAYITLKIKSKQINYITNFNSEVIEGNKSNISQLTDIWTFRRDIDSTNPNWKISATS